MNTELEGAALDAEVARCLGQAPYFGRSHLAPPNASSIECWRDGNGWPIAKFSSDWEVAGPIIDLEQIDIEHYGREVMPSLWEAAAEVHAGHRSYGPTALIAAMRAYVRSKTPNVAFSGVPAGHSINHPAGGTSACNAGLGPL